VPGGGSPGRQRARSIFLARPWHSATPTEQASITADIACQAVPYANYLGDIADVVGEDGEDGERGLEAGVAGVETAEIARSSVLQIRVGKGSAQ
jgi:hypothetical protein